jgi:heme-degrading monooxygenase HmoA
MFVRMSTIQGESSRMDRTQLPDDEQLRALPGFREAILLRDSASGKIVTLTFWESLEQLESSAQNANRLRQAIADSAGASEAPKVEVFELAERTYNREMEEAA